MAYQDYATCRSFIVSLDAEAVLDPTAPPASDRLLAGAVSQPARLQPSRSDRADRILTHRLAGVLIFVLVNALVFQAIYAWSGPLMDGVDALFATLGAGAAALLPPGPLQSLVVDGLIAAGRALGTCAGTISRINRGRNSQH